MSVSATASNETFDLSVFCQSLLQSIDELMLVVGPRFHIVAFNETAEKEFLLVHGKKLKLGVVIFDLMNDDDQSALPLLFARALGGERIDVRRVHQLSGGREVAFLNILRPLVHEGANVGVIVHSKNVTDEYKAEQRLIHSNERFYRAAEASFDMIWEYEVGSGTTHFVSNAAEMLGYTEDSISDDRFLSEMVHPEDVVSLRERIRIFLASGEKRITYPLHRLRRTDGRYIYVEANAVATRDASGRLVRVTGVTRDITTRHLLREKLAETNRRYEMAARASMDLVFEANLNTNEVIHNEVIQTVYGYEPGELDVTGMWLKLIHPADRRAYAAAIEKSLAKGRDTVHFPLIRLCKKNGDVVFTEIKALLVTDADGKLIKRIGSARDISHRHQLEQELRTSRERFARAVDASFDMIWEIDIDHKKAYFSEQQRALLGYEQYEVSDPRFFFSKIVHPADRDLLKTASKDILNSNEVFAHFPVHRLRRKDGTYLYVDVRVCITRDAEGKPLLITGVTHDVTRRLLDEMELRQLNKELQERAQELQSSIDRYELVSKATSDVVWDWDLARNETWYSPNMKKQFGYDPAAASAIKTFCEDHVHPDERNAIMESVMNAIADRRSQWEGEYRFRRADGSYAWVLDRGHMVYDEGGEPLRMIGSMQDITKVKELQERIFEEQISRQRLVTEAAIRSQEDERALLGRELHDNINQILASCKVMTEMALRDEPVREVLLPRVFTQINIAIEEIRKLSRRLVSPALGDIDLIEALRELVESSAAGLPVLYQFNVEGTPRPLDQRLSLMLYRVAQEQLHNIQKYAGAHAVEVRLRHDENAVLLSVSDDGCGFDPTVRRPGIGLRNIRTRAELFGGKLSLATSPGNGCRLEVQVPQKNNE